MNILFLSHTAMCSDFKVGSHHLAIEFEKAGYTVVHASLPITPFHAFCSNRKYLLQRIKGIRYISEGSRTPVDYVFTSLLPWSIIRRLPLSFNARMSLLGVAYTSRKLKDQTFDLILIDEPRLAWALKKLNYKYLIYRPTDIYPMMLQDPRIEDLEKHILELANAVIATSAPVASHIRRLRNIPVSVLENAVDYNFFSTPQESPLSKELPDGFKAIYIGAFDERLDTELILETADLCPEVTFVLAGPAATAVIRQFNSRRNIRYLGSVPYDVTPSLLQGSQVGLLPFSSHPANQGRSPMKLYEFAAAGLPVVAIETEEIKRRRLPFVLSAKDRTEFKKLVLTTSNDSNLQILAKAAKSSAISQSWKRNATLIISKVPSC